MTKGLGVVVGVLGLVVALFTNVDKLIGFYYQWTNPPIPSQSLGKWEYFSTNSGAEVAKVLSANSADPAEVWGHLQGGQYFHVWYRKGEKGASYEYKYVSWVPGEPFRVDVYKRSDKIVPLGFGGAGGTPVLIYLEVSRKE